MKERPSQKVTRIVRIEGGASMTPQMCEESSRLWVHRQDQEIDQELAKEKQQQQSATR